MADYVLYGTEVSYFSGKARAYLRWRGVDFEERLTTRDVYRDVILPTVGWPVIPVLALPDGTLVQDTTDIIETVEARIPDGPRVMPDEPVQRVVTRLLDLFADEWLVIPAMHYRWNYNEDWIYSEFGRTSAPDAPPAEQYAIGRKNGERFRGAVPMLGVTEETIPGVESAYETFLRNFSAHLEHSPYVLGGRPSLGDFSLIGPLYAHLYRDPESGRLMERVAPKVADYVRRVVAGDKGTGSLLEDDVIPQTLEPILSVQMTEQMPVLVETTNLFGAWASDVGKGADVPRGFGMVDFETGSHTGECAARSFPLWRLQAVTDEIDAMDIAAKARLGDLLERIGGVPLMDLRLPARLERRDYRLKLA
ncbi:glutathione S-transferase [Hyphomonas johnsonii]|uniref:Glutathione S-transferase n=1 Tax=Hyphomonas johnsonii MHS-2 TaxID=1280950 RepID=A0A059FQQ5_9PROT|nr:glutathione S-transferase [Hyphomonas johnsonii]KCZ92979.1 glutathione S-transferase [Hyphomonas johnsonii MHS-2]